MTAGHKPNQVKPVFVNQAFAEIDGYDALIDIHRLRSFFDLMAPADRERLKPYRPAPHYQYDWID